MWLIRNSPVFIFTFLSSLALADDVKIKTIELEWDPIPRASHYEIKLTPVEPGEELVFRAEEPRLVQEVPIGQYKLQVRSKARGIEYYSKWSRAIELDVQLKDVELLEPADKFTFDAKDRIHTVEFKWKRLSDAHYYTLSVWTVANPTDIKTFRTTGTSKKLSLKTGEIYQWKVEFHNPKVNYTQQPAIFTLTLLGKKLSTPQLTRTVLDGEPPQVKWKPTAKADNYLVRMEYRYLDEATFTKYKEFETPNTQFNVPEDMKRGVYRLSIIARAKYYGDSEPGQREIELKPPAEAVAKAIENLPFDNE